jgi:hypothetical protein
MRGHFKGSIRVQTCDIESGRRLMTSFAGEKERIVEYSA